VYEVCRFEPKGEPKEFRPRRSDPEPGWYIWDIEGVTRLPYRLRELKKGIAERQPIYICEGEKDVDNLAKVGVVATTNSSGSGNWAPELNQYFADAQVRIIPDNDVRGRTHCKKVGEALTGVAASISVLELPGLSQKGDASDWIVTGGTADQLRALPTQSFADWLAVQPKPEETIEERIARLAKLSPVAYEQVRASEAKDLDVRPAFLDKLVAKVRGEAAETAAAEKASSRLADPEPWEEEVDLADLLSRLVEMVKEYMVLPKGAPEIFALWVIHAFAHDCFGVSPVLAIVSPTPECGKTSLLTILWAITPRALMASNVTTASLFRVIDSRRPTLLIDEADTFLTENDEMRGVLNSGHNKIGAVTIRMVETAAGYVEKEFSTWAPKAIAQIGLLHPTLTGRSVRVELQKKRPGQKLKRLRGDQLGHLEPFKRQAARWVQDHKAELADADPAIPDELGNRPADNYRPLFAIADAAGGDWPQRIRQIALGDKVPEQELGIMLLEDIKKVFFDEDGEQRLEQITSSHLIGELVKDKERPWVAYRRGQDLSQKQLANLLRPFKIPSNNLYVGTQRPKGYKAKQFLHAFAAYLGFEPLRRYKPQETAKNDENSSATFGSSSGSKTDDFCQFSAGWSGVAAEKPENGARATNSSPDACAYCGKGGETGELPLPRMNDTGGNHYVHAVCYPDWIRGISDPRKPPDQSGPEQDFE
jgi:putative DNA primase/helicase